MSLSLRVAFPPTELEQTNLMKARVCDAGGGSRMPFIRRVLAHELCQTK